MSVYFFAIIGAMIRCHALSNIIPKDITMSCVKTREREMMDNDNEDEDDDDDNNKGNDDETKMMTMMTTMMM